MPSSHMTGRRLRLTGCVAIFPYEEFILSFAMYRLPAFPSSAACTFSSLAAMMKS